MLRWAFWSEVIHTTQAVRVRFGDCVLDASTRLLHRGGRVVPLAPKAFRLLEVLIELRPRALSRPEVHDRLWPDTFVSASSLNRLIAEVRAAIGDDARAPRFVRTVHGHGYAFCGEATSEPQEIPPTSTAVVPRPLAYLMLGKHEYALQPGDNLIGRAADCLVVLPSPRVSRRHARVRLADGRATVEDLGSTNGTFVSGERLAQPRELRDGDEVLVGPSVLRFRAVSGTRSTVADTQKRKVTG